MRFRSAGIRLLLLAMLATGTAAATAQSGIEATPRPEHVAYARFFDASLAEEGIPGGAFAIIAEGRIVLARGYGVRGVSDPAPVDADTVFRIASVSKTVATQLTATLVQEGVVSWDEQVSRHVPDLAFARPRHAGALQLRHLLGHTTGIAAGAYNNLIEDDVPLEDIVPAFADVVPVCDPGACYGYQNVLFSLVQPVLERKAGRSYESLVRTRVFAPLGMLRSSLGMEAFLAERNRARPHSPTRDGWREAEVLPTYYRVAAAAGVNSSANDMARLLLAQLGHRPDIAPADMLAPLREPRVRTPGELDRRGWKSMLSDAHYGLGWRIYRVGDDVVYLHSGWVKGFVAEISYSLRHRTGLVLLLNGETNSLGTLSARFWSETLARDPPQTSMQR